MEGSLLGGILMLVLVPTTLGAAWAGITRRYGLAALLFSIPIVILAGAYFAGIEP